MCKDCAKMREALEAIVLWMKIENMHLGPEVGLLYMGMLALGQIPIERKDDHGQLPSLD